MDVPLALRSARKFHRSAKSGIATLVRPLNVAPEYDVAEIAFLATQLTFATELYLKFGLTLQRTVPPYCHNLISLFDKLNEEIRRRLEASYRSKMSDYAEGTATSLILLATRTPDEQPGESAERGTGATLREVLKETGDAYKTWRYLFQAPSRTPGQYVISFYHVGLDVLCDSMDEHFRPMLTPEAS
jgi:hypothetical protein